jgi:hypothetical protein
VGISAATPEAKWFAASDLEGLEEVRSLHRTQVGRRNEGLEYSVLQKYYEVSS